LQRGIKDDDDDVDRLKNDLKQTELKQDQLRDKLKQANEDLEETKRDRNRLRDKLGQANENLEETKRDRDQYRKKFEQANDELKEIKRDQFSKKSEQHNDSFESKQHEHDKQLKLNQTGRSSPGLKHDEDRHRESPNLSTTRIKRPQSPTVDKQALRSSNTSLMTAAKNVSDDSWIKSRSNL
jgi:chromosome segregation ATPase